MRDQTVPLRRVSERADQNDVGTDGDNEDGGSQGGSTNETFAPSGSFAVNRLLPTTITAGNRSTRGRRSYSLNAERGLTAGSAKPIGSPRDIALAGTLQAAALRRARPISPSETALPTHDKFAITHADLRTKVRRARVGNLLLFVVDSSGSMGARKRMALVKGVMIMLLLDAYQKRDLVGLISFRGSGARLLVPPTNSVDVAERQLRHMPTGGRTPLGAGLLLAGQTLERYARREVALSPLVVLITDGRSNTGISPLDGCAGLVKQSIPTVVIDSEQGYVRMGAAAQLAQAMGARCVSIDGLHAHAQDGRQLRGWLGSG